MHLWVTRPIEDAAGLRAQLIAQGHEVTPLQRTIIAIQACVPILARATS